MESKTTLSLIHTHKKRKRDLEPLLGVANFPLRSLLQEFPSSQHGEVVYRAADVQRVVVSDSSW